MVSVGATMLKTPKVKATSTKASVSLKWFKVSGAKGYTIQRKSGSKFKKVANIRKTVYTDKSVKAGKNYTYRVRAYGKQNKKKVYSSWKQVTIKTKGSQSTFDPSVKMISKSDFKKRTGAFYTRAEEILGSDVKIKKSDTHIVGETYTGTAYYVSESGDDANDGKSESTPWKTLKHVELAPLNPGDAVFFKRGDTFRGGIEVRKGVTYSAYGSGKKPRFMGSPESGADPSKWSEYGKTKDGGTVWVFYKDMTDCSCIFLDGEKALGTKVTPNWNGSGFETEKGEPFEVLNGLTKDLDFFSPADSLYPNQSSGFVDIGGSIKDSKGKLYFRCDKGNPGDVFDQIEIGTTVRGTASIIETQDDVAINELDICYGSSCGVTSLKNNVVIENCVISWCGGYVLRYMDRVPERCGDGICGAGDRLTIRNCYFHDNWDNGITIETGYGGKTEGISQVTITGNAVERQAANALQFICFESSKETSITFSDVTVEDNYLYGSPDSWSYPYRSNGTFDDGTEDSSCMNLGDPSCRLLAENFEVKKNVLYSDRGASVWGGLGDRNVRFNENTFLLSNKKYPVAVLCPMDEQIHGWYRLNGKDENGVELLNESMGKKNEFLICE